MQKISIYDFVRLSSKETNKICQVKLGDLVRLYFKRYPRKEIIGIITQLGNSGLVGPIAVAVIFWLFRHQKDFD